MPMPRYGARVAAAATVMRERVRVYTKPGLRTGWTATHVRIALAVARGDRSLTFAREALLGCATSASTPPSPTRSPT